MAPEIIKKNIVTIHEHCLNKIFKKAQIFIESYFPNNESE